jgi:hypothetical protein
MSKINGADRLVLDAAQTVNREQSWPDRADKMVCVMREKYGLGDEPALREEVYRRIRASVILYGRPAHRVILDLFLRSETKAYPARWFCKSALNELQRKKLLVS